MGFIIGSIDINEDEYPLSPPIHPTSAYLWEGFQVLPTEDGVNVAVRSMKRHSYQVFDGVNWVDTADVIYHTPEQIREGLRRWIGGGIQFSLMHTQYQPTEIKIGFWTSKMPMRYLVEDAILSLLREPVRLVTELHGQADLTQLYLPPNLDIERIRSCLVVPYDQVAQPGVINPDGRTISVETHNSEPPYGGVVRLILEVELRVDLARGDYQIEEYPTCIVRVPDRTKAIRYYEAFGDNILIPGASRYWKAYAEADRPIDIKVMAQNKDEAEAIASQLIGRIVSKGFVYAPPFDMNFALMVNADISRTDDEQTFGELAAASFEVLILGVPQGEITGEEPRILMRLDAKPMHS
jgi:hypothetical protein